jgi:hypothetical protein
MSEPRQQSDINGDAHGGATVPSHDRSRAVTTGMRIEYVRSDCQAVAWAAIDRSEVVEVVLSGWHIRFAKKALPACRALFESGERSARSFIDVALMVFYGWPLTSLLIIYSHAVLAGMRATWSETEGEFVVSFRLYESP